VLLAGPGQGEADHVVGDGAAERWAVAAGGGGDLDRRSPRRLELGGRPRGQAAGVAAQPAAAGSGREDDTGRREQGPASAVEVVAVVVVTDQHGVDWPRSVAAIARPVNFRELEPQPKL
jgi:hypothetical protein